jgi:hypothetical protein
MLRFLYIAEVQCSFGERLTPTSQGWMLKAQEQQLHAILQDEQSVAAAGATGALLRKHLRTHARHMRRLWGLADGHSTMSSAFLLQGLIVTAGTMYNILHFFNIPIHVQEVGRIRLIRARCVGTFDHIKLLNLQLSAGVASR